jgi:hypothetical protein
MKKMYISGRITGQPDFIERFAKAEKHLKARGFEVMNPATLPHDHGRSWGEYMADCLKELLSCDGVYMLKGWKNSRGARIEKQLAQDLGFKLIYFERV